MTTGRGIALWAFTLVAACAGDERPAVSPTTLTSGTPTTDVDGTVDAIAQARCDREIACGNVGTTSPWATRGACLAAVAPGDRAELEKAACPNAFAPAAIAECQAQIQQLTCTNVAVRLSWLGPCEPARLCAP